MKRRAGGADLPLHGGRVLAWLGQRMTRFGAVLAQADATFLPRDGARDINVKRVDLNSLNGPARTGMTKSRSATLVLGAMLIGSPVLADECGQRGDFDAIDAAIRSAPNCRGAAGIARACSLGASGDVALAGAVVDVCERDFLGKLDRRGRASYDRQRKACFAKYRKDLGTMYRSAEAFCEAGVAERLSRAVRARPSSAR